VNHESNKHELRDASDRVEQVPISQLKPAGRNARIHSKAQIEKIAASIERFGFVNPILADKGGRVIAGHGRLEAATLRGLRTVPVLRIEHLSPSEIRAYAIADNRLAELADWDKDILKLELGELSIDLPDLDLTVTGYETGELDLIILGDRESDIASAGEADEGPEIEEGPVVSRPGDIWDLGPHRLVCGDARLSASFDSLLGERVADLMITDPPYNVRIDGHARGLGQHQHMDFAMASGEMSEHQFSAFLEQVFTNLAHRTRSGSLHYTFMDWRHMREVLSAGGKAYDQLLNLCVWDKGTGGMGSLYRSQHELVFVWKSGPDPHINNVQLGSFGRNRTNVWHYPGANSFGPERSEMLALHPTVKPVALIADAILDASDRGALVLDPFCGSGSTIIAAEKVNRVAAGIELDPRYVDVAVRRFERLTGTDARHAISGLSFAEETALRSVSEGACKAKNDADPTAKGISNSGDML
jgi:DNA modification methylase